MHAQAQSLVQSLVPIDLPHDNIIGGLNSIPVKAQFRFTNNYKISNNYLGHVINSLMRINQESSDISMNDIAEYVAIPKERLRSVMTTQLTRLGTR